MGAAERLPGSSCAAQLIIGARCARAAAMDLQRAGAPESTVALEEERYVRELGRARVVQRSSSPDRVDQDTRPNPVDRTQARRAKQARPAGGVGKRDCKLAEIEHAQR